MRIKNFSINLLIKINTKYLKIKILFIKYRYIKINF
jgi:hypothetical protein